MVPEISVATLQEKLQQGDNVFLLDVRETHEFIAFNIQGYLIPLGQLLQRVSEIPQDKLIVVYCRSGQRSAVAVDFLNQYGFKDVRNLAGGMLAWQYEMQRKED